VPDTVDVDADAHVLSRHVRRPATARPQPQAHAVTCLGDHSLHAPTRLTLGPERIQVPEVVVREERRGEDDGCIKETDDQRIPR